MDEDERTTSCQRTDNFRNGRVMAWMVNSEKVTLPVTAMWPTGRTDICPGETSPHLLIMRVVPLVRPMHSRVDGQTLEGGVWDHIVPGDPSCRSLVLMRQVVLNPPVCAPTRDSSCSEGETGWKCMAVEACDLTPVGREPHRIRQLHASSMHHVGDVCQHSHCPCIRAAGHEQTMECLAITLRAPQPLHHRHPHSHSPLTDLIVISTGQAHVQMISDKAFKWISGQRYGSGRHHNSGQHDQDRGTFKVSDQGQTHDGSIITAGSVFKTEAP